MENETLESAAPDEGQPVAEAVADVSSAEPSFGDGGSAPEEGQPAPRLYAGKYKSPEELEQSYLDSQREASRMAGELAALRRTTSQPATRTSTEPEYKQLEKNRDAWAAIARDANETEERRENARYQVMLHSEKIAEERAFHRFQETSSKQSASQALESEAVAVFETYQQDLSPGSPLYTMAEQRYLQMLKAGYPEGTASKADAVLWAAHKTGASKTRVIQSDRKELLGNLQKQARSAVKNGAGTASVVKPAGVTAKQIETMSDAEFAKYEREHVLGA